MGVLLVLLLLLLVIAATSWFTKASASKAYKKQLAAAHARLAAWEAPHAQQAQTGTGPGSTTSVVESFTMGWTNVLLSALWVPVLEKQVSLLTADRLQLLLNELLSKNKHKKPWAYINKLTVEQVTFGYVPPRFQHCLAQYDPATKRLQLSMDAHFRSTGLQAVLLANVAQLGPLQPFSLRLQVTRVELSGRLLLGLTVCTEPPGIKSLDYSFAASPHFDLHAVPVGGWAAGLAGSGLATELPAILVSNLRTAILRAMNRRIVAPYRKAIDIVKIWKNKHVAKVGGAGGVLRIVVVGVRGLLPDHSPRSSGNGAVRQQHRHSNLCERTPDAAAASHPTQHSHVDQAGGSTTEAGSDVFVELQCGREVFRTPIVHTRPSNGNPVWNWQFDIKLRAPLPTEPSAHAGLSAASQAVQDTWPPQVPAVLHFRLVQAQALGEPQLLSEAAVQLPGLALQPNTLPVPVNVPLTLSSTAAQRHTSSPGGWIQGQAATQGTLHLTCCWQQATTRKDPFPAPDVTGPPPDVRISTKGSRHSPISPPFPEVATVMQQVPLNSVAVAAVQPPPAHRQTKLGAKRAVSSFVAMTRSSFRILLQPLRPVGQHTLLLLAALWQHLGHLTRQQAHITSARMNRKFSTAGHALPISSQTKEQQQQASADVFITGSAAKSAHDGAAPQQVDGWPSLGSPSPAQHTNLPNGPTARSPDTQGIHITSPTVETPKPAALPPRPSSAGWVYSSPGLPGAMPADHVGHGAPSEVMPATPTQAAPLHHSRHASFSNLIAVLRGQHGGVPDADTALHSVRVPAQDVQAPLRSHLTAGSGSSYQAADAAPSDLASHNDAHQHGASASVYPSNRSMHPWAGMGATAAVFEPTGSGPEQTKAVQHHAVNDAPAAGSAQHPEAADETPSSLALGIGTATNCTAWTRAADSQTAPWNSRRHTYPTLDPVPAAAAAASPPAVEGVAATPSLDTCAGAVVNPLQTLAQTLHMQGLLDEERAHKATLQQQLSELQHKLGALQRIWRAEGRRALLEGATFLWHQQPASTLPAAIIPRAVFVCLLDGCAVLRVLLQGSKKNDSNLMTQAELRQQTQGRAMRVLRRARSSGRSTPTTLWSPGQPLLLPLYIPLDSMQSVQLGSHLFPAAPTTEGWAGIKAMFLGTRVASTAGLEGTQQSRGSSGRPQASNRDDATCLSVVLRGGATLHLQLPPQGNGRSRDEWARALQDLLPT